MWRTGLSKQYAIVLAQYVAKFHQTPPSILTERGAMEMMLEALRNSEPLERASNNKNC